MWYASTSYSCPNMCTKHAITHLDKASPLGGPVVEDVLGDGGACLLHKLAQEVLHKLHVFRQLQALQGNGLLVTLDPEILPPRTRNRTIISYCNFVIIQYFCNSDLYNATDSWLHLTPKSSHLAQGFVRSVIVNMFLYISDETSVQLEHLKRLEAFQDHWLLAKFDTKNLPPSTEVSTIILTLDNRNYVIIDMHWW